MEELLKNEDICDELTEDNLEEIAGGCSVVWLGVRAAGVAMKVIRYIPITCGRPRTK